MNENEVPDNVMDPVGQPTGIFGRVSDPTNKNTGVVLDPYRQPTESVDSMRGSLWQIGLTPWIEGFSHTTACKDGTCGIKIIRIKTV